MKYINGHLFSLLMDTGKSIANLNQKKLNILIFQWNIQFFARTIFPTQPKK